MLIEQTMKNLKALRLHGMARAFQHQRDTGALQDLTFDCRLGLLVDAELAERNDRRLQRLLKEARLKVAASPEAVDYTAPRGLDKRKFASLLTCEWIRNTQHVIFTGPTGLGKTWLACALGNQAARQGFAVRYRQCTRLLENIEVARADGSLGDLRTKLARTKVIILDDWGIVPLTAQQRQDLWQFVDDGMSTRSLIISAQVPVDSWHAFIGESTIADAVLDRIVHTAHRFDLKGESLRRSRGTSSKGTKVEQDG